MHFNVAPDRLEKQPNIFDLIIYIKETHHEFTRSQLSLIAMQLDKSEKNGVPVTLEVVNCCQKLQTDLLTHLIKEERILFPYIAELSQHPSNPPHSCFGSVSNPIRMMGREHTDVKNILSQLRALTEDFNPPVNCAPSISALYIALAELDRDLVEHMYWEDEVLFPHAIKLESEASISI